MLPVMRRSISAFEICIALYLSISAAIVLGLPTGIGAGILATILVIGAGALFRLEDRRLHREKYRLPPPLLLSAQDTWSAVGARLDLTLLEDGGLALLGTVEGAEVQVHACNRSGNTHTELIITAPNLSSTFTAEDFSMILEATRAGGTLGSAREWSRHNMLLEDAATRTLLADTTFSELTLSQGTLSAARSEILTDTLEETILAAVQLTIAIRLALLAPLRNLARRLGLGVDADRGDMVGEVSGITVRITPKQTRYVLAAVVPGLPEDLTVSRRSPRAAPGLLLGDPILDSMVVVDSPRPEDRDRFGSDLHGDLLTVVCGRGGVVKHGVVRVVAVKGDLEGALEDAVRLAGRLAGGGG
ncbi:MAG: hypothetical protein ACI8RZ_000892 [Myxococcota bacterium]|jgi:hypothetical protein